MENQGQGLLSHTAGYPLGKRLSGKYDGTFACKTLQERLPKVLTQIIDTLHQYEPIARKQHGDEGTTAVKNVLSKLSELRYRMQTDKEMESISTGEDLEEWKNVFEIYQRKLGTPPRWFAVSWLFLECYMYRRVMEIIKSERCLGNYDPFKQQKEQSFIECKNELKIVGMQIQEWIDQDESAKKVAMKNMFGNFLLLCLWGNKIDLSLATTMDTYKMTYTVKATQLSEYVLSDHSEQIWEILSTPRKVEEKKEVAIVLDNAGYELFSDFCFGEFLLSAGLADRVTLYCKNMPWFVSDVTHADILWTLEQLKSLDDPILSTLGERWLDRLSNGTLLVVEHSFWTTSYEYAAMKQVAPDLYSALSKAILVLFKGDLNYRKLIADRNWSYIKEFSSALQGFHPTNIAALRTLKADLVAGLPEGAALRANRENKDWMVAGQYAVLQVHQQ